MNAASAINSFSLKDVHSLRNPIFGLTERVKEIVGKLTELRNRRDLHQILTQFFPEGKYADLRVFFEKNPSAWSDFMRKLNKHKKERNDEARSMYVDELFIADIMETLLVRGRKEDIGETIVGEMRAGINNPALLRFASKQPSILDGSGYSFSQLDKSTRLESIKKLIIAGLTNNIDLCNEKNVEKYFVEIFPQILNYLGKLFGRKYEFPSRVRSINECASALQKMFNSPDYIEDAWMIVQAFYAWPRVNEIVELCAKAKSDIPKMEQSLQSVGIDITGVQKEDHITGATLYHASLHLEGKSYKMSWRIKTPESILQKMWQKSQYNNVDAMRDIIGMNIIYPDNATDADKKALLEKFALLMPNYGYLLKNKGAVKNSEGLTEGLEKKPIAIKEEKSEMTHKDFTNMSLSGYMKLGKTPYGAEIQFMSESEAGQKKAEDSYYKLRGALDAFFRGPKYRTPADLYSFVEARVGVNYLHSLSCDNYGDLFVRLIEDEYLIAYRLSKGEEFIFTVKGKEDAISEIFPEAKKITKKSSDLVWYKNLRDYVRNDSKMKSNAELAKSGTSLLPPYQGGGGQFGDALDGG